MYLRFIQYVVSNFLKEIYIHLSYNPKTSRILRRPKI